MRPFERVPAELQAYAQWVNWRQEHAHKVPVNPHTLGNAGVGWANTWSSFDQAKAVSRDHQLGLGFVLTEQDPYTVIDLDGCVGEKGRISAHTRELLDLLAGWVELSPSATGLHIWVVNHAPVNRRAQGIEIYSNARWITVTGRSHPQAPQVIPERTAELTQLVRRYFPPQAQASAEAPPLPEDDDALWEMLFRSRHGAFFAALYRGDTSVCYHDHSRAVILLANHLARLTDLDAVRVKRLLYQTGLVRDKWEARRGPRSWIDQQVLDAIRYVAGRRR